MTGKRGIVQLNKPGINDHRKATGAASGEDLIGAMPHPSNRKNEMSEGLKGKEKKAKGEPHRPEHLGTRSAGWRPEEKGVDALSSQPEKGKVTLRQRKRAFKKGLSQRNVEKDRSEENFSAVIKAGGTIQRDLLCRRHAKIKKVFKEVTAKCSAQGRARERIGTLEGDLGNCNQGYEVIVLNTRKGPLYSRGQDGRVEGTPHFRNGEERLPEGLEKKGRSAKLALSSSRKKQKKGTEGI